MRTPALVTVAVCTALLLGHICFDTLKPASSQHRSNPQAAAPQDSPVLAALKAAAAGDKGSTPLAQIRDGVTHNITHNETCCRIGPMQGVLAAHHCAAAAAAFRKAARSLVAAGSMHEARQMIQAFRPHLAKPWAEALQPVVTANLQGDNSSCQCRSVEVLPATQQPPSNSSTSTAILLVLNSWLRLVKHSLNVYSPNLLMLWFYARMHGYGLHIYVHGADLPPWMPVYFIKPAGLLHMMDDLHYQNVMYVDWDVMLTPHTAPPLSIFYGEYPEASLLLQGEYNFEAGVNLWRNTPDAWMFLQAWWDLGAQGCCPTAQHDQSAFKHIVAAYLANLTGDASLYGPTAQSYFKLPASLPPPPATHPPKHSADAPFKVLSTESPPTPVDRWVQLRPIMQEKGSAIGIVGLDVHYPRHPSLGPPKVAFANCMGLWWGCTFPDSPALLYHVGSGKMTDLQPDWMAQRLMNYLLDWLDSHRHTQGTSATAL